MSVKLAIFGRNQLVVEGLTRLLEDFENFEIVGGSCDYQEMREVLRTSHAEIIVSDNPGCCALIEKNPKQPHPKVLLLSDNDKNPLLYDELKDMIASGLAGIMPKSGDSQLLRKALAKLQSGEFWIDHKTIGNILTNFNSEQKKISLTKKEKEILKYICSGESNKNIAKKLCISEQTVKSHCNHLFKKFGVPNRVKLALYATKLIGRIDNGKEPTYHHADNLQ